MSRQAHQSLVRNSRSWTSIAVYDTLRLDRRIDYFGILQLVYTLIVSDMCTMHSGIFNLRKAFCAFAYRLIATHVRL